MDRPIAIAIDIEIHGPTLVLFRFAFGFCYTIFASNVYGTRIDNRGVGAVDRYRQCAISSDGIDFLIGAGVEDFPIVRDRECRGFLGTIAGIGMRGG